MSEFKERVINMIMSIPYGHIFSYGQIATYVGVPRAARQVGWIMRSVETKVDLPWWRVVNNSGRITIKGNIYNDQPLQKKLLEAEGVIIADDFTLDINKYRYILSEEELKKLNLNDSYIKTIHEKYFPT
jgi:methylated-DNA-protein-cysteine methyltransferase-like protein